MNPNFESSLANANGRGGGNSILRLNLFITTAQTLNVGGKWSHVGHLNLGQYLCNSDDSSSFRRFVIQPRPAASPRRVLPVVLQTRKNSSKRCRDFITIIIIIVPLGLRTWHHTPKYSCFLFSKTAAGSFFFALKSITKVAGELQWWDAKTLRWN